jgi:hypothetical protein
MTDAVTYHFSAEKNALLKQQRGIGFDDIVFLIENDFVLEIISNPIAKYSHQKMYIIDVAGYTYVVPCVLDNKGIFLKTIYPSRDMTAKYIKNRGQK